MPRIPLRLPATEVRGILKNISWLAAASLLVKPAWLLFIAALCPRLLGVEAYGELLAALALVGIAMSFADLGVTQLSVREVARARHLAGRYFTNGLPYRGLLLVVAWAGAVGAALALGYRAAALGAVVVAGLYGASQSVVMYERAFFRGFENLRYDAVSNVVEKALVLAAGVLALVATRSAVGVLGGMGAAMTAVAVGQTAWISARLAPLRRRLLSPAFARRVALAAIPFGIADLLMTLYLRVDQVMIEAVLGASAVGQYGQAYRVLEALSIVPAIVAQGALYPRLSVLAHTGERRRFARLMGYGALGLLVLSGGAAVALTLGGPALLHLLVPDPAFAPAGPALQVLCWSFPLTCVKDLLFVSFYATGHFRAPTLTLGVAALFNVAGNALLLPRYGILGAAAMTVASELLVVVIFTAYFFYTRRASARRASEPTAPTCAS
jgi:O-antigen/teichoic acid export membrane protein